ncbi:MAG TPA: sulfurtransferase [Methanoregulaceae archaeon]|nr:sulfurtransferase [Methanoregulaceae archaeon]
MPETYPYPPGEGIVKWVSTGWLEDHLGDKGLTIIDCQPNIHEYIQDHIPGARYVHEGIFRLHGEHLPSEWVVPEIGQAIIRTLGLEAGSPVVVYSSGGPLTGCGAFIGDGLEQTMVTYSLIRYGLRNVCLLDGGFEKWRDEGRPLTRVFPQPVKPSVFMAELKMEFFAGYKQVLAIKDRSDAVLLDARPPAFYEGQGPWIKAGHIPGAVSLPWKTLMDDKNKKLLRAEAEIKKMVVEKGVTPDKTVICSCGTGREATNEFILFKYFLGYPKVLLYEGGFTEWTSYPENPVVTGKNPR